MNQYLHVRWKAIALLMAGILIFGCTDEIGPAELDLFESDDMYPYEFDGVPGIEGPDRLLFLGLEEGETHIEEAKIKNVGRTGLYIDEFLIDDDFDLAIPEGFEGAHSYLRPGDSVNIYVGYTAFDDEPREGTLTIVSNDPEQSELQIDLLANVELPCLEVDPVSILNFGSVDQQVTAERRIRLTNCGEGIAVVASLLDFQPDGGFSFATPGDTERVIEPGTTQTVPIAFAPTETRDYRGSVTIIADGGLEEDITIELRGAGAPPPCPNAVISGFSDQQTSEANPSATLQGTPLETVYFDASASRAASGGDIVDYEWTLVNSPQDTLVNLGQSAQSSENDLYLELSGVYVVELHVWDDEGTRSCDPARLVVEAISEDAIHLQLVWDTPNDPDPHSTSGTDLDLHFLHENGQWNSAPYDCYWMNMNPTWGDPNDWNANPRLDADETKGWGPENINLREPEAGIRYSVGVDYFSDHGYGASYATVRIFIHGQLAIEVTDRYMEDGQFWHVADIDWPSGEITLRDTVTNGFPN